MKKFVITAVAATALAVPAVASADAPDGTFVFKANDGAGSADASLVGELSSQIKQNGQFTGGNSGVWDQATSPGSRAELVQGYLGH